MRQSRRILFRFIRVRCSNEIKKILRSGEYPEDQIFDLNEYCQYYDPGQYFSPDFMTYDLEEVLIDTGSCDLNSSLVLRKYCGHVKKVYAFAPDPGNVAVCLEKKQRLGLDWVNLLPFGAWSERTTLHFDATNDCASHSCEGGKIRVPVVSIDETVDPEDKITMIKMDIECAELEALKSSRKTILRDRPKLAICICHKPEDMVEIPLYIKELVPEYRLGITPIFSLRQSFMRSCLHRADSEQEANYCAI